MTLKRAYEALKVPVRWACIASQPRPQVCQAAELFSNSQPEWWPGQCLKLLCLELSAVQAV